LEKQLKAKRAEGVAQVVAHPPSKCKAPSSNFRTTPPKNLDL
jgi:hypothetical protein